jgi:hypothetical protein
MRYFLTAPVFALFAALLLLIQGPSLPVSRWSPSALAFTHCLTIGFLSMAMIGALLQILQVVAGVEVFKTRLTATAVHALLCAGCLLLCGGFLREEALLFMFALPCLLLGFGWLLAACAIGMWRTPAGTATYRAIRLSLGGLAIAVLIGALIASAFIWPLPLPLLLLTDLHASWGLLAWVGLLVAGVAFQVVPMFQVTELYPASLTRWLGNAVFVLLMLRSTIVLAAPVAWHWLRLPVELLLGSTFIAFGIATLQLIRRRKRPTSEATTLFWYTSAASLMGCMIVWLLAPWLMDASYAPTIALVTGVLFIVGFAYSVVNGMLYKIVPFLVWYHLQHRITDRSQRAPNVRQVIAPSAALAQFWTHIAALVLLLGACAWPQWLARPAALAFGVSSGWLLANLVRGTALYIRTLSGMPRPAPAHPVSPA